MRRISPAAMRTALVWLLPPAAATAAFGALLAQRSGTWAELMPAARFPVPGRGGVLVLANDADHGDAIVDGALDAPQTRIVWLVPREAVTPRFAAVPEGTSVFLAVAPDGSLARAALDPAGRLEFRPDSAWSANSADVLVASDAATRSLIASRLPKLATLKTSWTYRELFDPDRPDRSDRLDPVSIVRICGMVGLFVSAMVLMWNLSRTSPTPLRWATALLGYPAAASVLAGALLVCGSWGTWVLPALPFVLWALLGAACRFTEFDDAPSAPEPASPRRRLSTWVAGGAAALAAIVWSVQVAQGFPHRHLTTGDSVRYISAARQTLEAGRWPLREFVARHGTDLITVMYPPGPSVFMAYCLWETGMDSSERFQPGRRTGAVWLLYAWFLLGLTATTAAAAVLAVSQMFPGCRGAAAVAAGAGVLYCLPTARAYIHAGETIFWPLTAATLIGAVIARSAGCRFAASAAILAAGGMSTTKPEATIVLGVLVLPLAITLLSLSPWRRRFSWKWIAAPAVASVIAAVPYVHWIREKAALGVAFKSGAIPSFGPGALIAERDLYGRVLKRTWRILVGPIGADDDPINVPVSQGAAFLISVGVAVTASQVLRHRWAMWAVPAGCAVYFFGMSAAYVFTEYRGGRAVQIEVSWNRLIVPMIMTAGILAAVVAAESSRVLRVLARRR